MSPTEPLIGINDIDATELPDYRPLYVPAVIGLVLGAFSFVALFHPVMWFWPLIALLVCLFSLHVLKQSDRLIGRKAAWCGIVLAVLFGVAAPARTVTYRWLEQRDARRFGEEWIAAVLSGDLMKAHQMTKYPNQRATLDENLPSLYEQSTELGAELDTYAKTPLVATLRALGPRATVRHYETEVAATDSRNDLVEDVYAVSYEDEGQLKTFFIKLPMWRDLRDDSGPRRWRLAFPEGGYKPKSWEA